MEKVLQAFMKHKWMNAQDCDIALRQYKTLIVHLKRTCNVEMEAFDFANKGLIISFVISVMLVNIRSYGKCSK